MVTQVLIISNPDDEHTRQVTRAIERLGGKPILFYPERFGTDLQFSLEHNPKNHQPRDTFWISGADRIDWEQIRSVWYRRPRLAALSDSQLTDEGLEFARDEWRSALAGMYALMEGRMWVSRPSCLEVAQHKPLQLKLAALLELKTPHTIVTNDPAKAKAFFETCLGRVIVKATGRGWVYARASSDLYFVMTNRVKPEDLQAENEIRLAPVTFQEEIPKLYEIRVNVVGQQVFAIKIDSQASPISELDWRRYDVQNTPYTPYQLPPDIEYKCMELTRLLGLEFGAIDFIRQPDGQYVFLEINGNGQFLWAEELSGVPVSQALANLLVGATTPLAKY